MIETTQPEDNKRIIGTSWKNLSPNAQRMMTYIVSKAYRQSFSIENLCEVVVLEDCEGKDEERLREAVMAALLELKNNGFLLYHKNGKWCAVSWLAKVIVDLQNGIVWAWIDEEIKPYFSLLAKARAN